MWKKQVPAFCNTLQKIWLNEMIKFNKNGLNNRSLEQDLKLVRVKCYYDTERRQ